MATAAQIARLKRDVPISSLSSVLPDNDAIGSLIDEHGGNHFLSVAHTYDLLAIKAAEKGGSIAVGKYREDFSAQADSYSKIAASWRKKVAFKGYIGGTSKDDRDDKLSDTDRIGSSITKGMDSLVSNTESNDLISD